MEFLILGLQRATFFNPIKNPSFQSILGQAPSFNPSSIYYALLTLAIVNDYYPYIIRPTVVQGSSPSIRAYYLDYWSHFGVLLLNKDTNTSASGFVDVTMSNSAGLFCTYLKAPSLNATSGFTYANYTFAPGNAAPQGTFEVH